MYRSPAPHLHAGSARPRRLQQARRQVRERLDPLVAVDDVDAVPGVVVEHHAEMSDYAERRGDRDGLRNLAPLDTPELVELSCERPEFASRWRT